MAEFDLSQAQARAARNKYPRSPDRQASIERRRRQAASGVVDAFDKCRISHDI